MFFESTQYSTVVVKFPFKSTSAIWAIIGFRHRKLSKVKLAIESSRGGRVMEVDIATFEFR